VTAALHLQQLVLVDFRSYTHLEVEFPPGRVALIGPNGVGKTNVLEAIAWLAIMQSFAVHRPTRSSARQRRTRGSVASFNTIAEPRRSTPSSQRGAPVVSPSTANGSPAPVISWAMCA
jgi:recombinational DNA repair ATPase RecF